MSKEYFCKMNRNDGVFVNIASSQHVQQQAVTPAVSNSPARSPKERNKYALFKLGAIEIIIGCLCLILGIIAIIIAANNKWYYGYIGLPPLRLYNDMTYTGQGIWGGVFAIVVGILGVKARSRPSQCMYNANMTLSIVGATVMGVFTVFSVIAAISTDKHLPALIASHVILATLGFFGMVLMIIHSAYCCAGVCHKSASYERVAVSYHPSPIGMQQPQLIQLANGQYVLAPTQMYVAPYPVVQVPVVGAPVTYNQPQQSVTPTHMRANISLQTQLTPAFMPVRTAPQQAVACTTQQAGATNSQQTAQVGKEQDNPPEYSTLSGHE